MPGRQAHGRPLLANSSSRKTTKNKPKARGNALDAFALAAQQVGTSNKGVRTRDLVAEFDQKRRRRNDEEDDDEEHGAAAVANSRSKRQKRDDWDADGSENELETDSEGNEWQVGVGEDDNDSDIDSDDAFGESDEEKFEGFIFEGSPSKKISQAEGDSDIDEDQDEDGSLGEDAIDLAQALDDFPEGDDELPVDSGSEEEDSASEAGSTDDDGGSEDDDPERMKALQDLVSGFADGGSGKHADAPLPRQKNKIDLNDLGLAGVKDANIKRSLKLLKKEEKATKPGVSKKLEVPLAKRQNDRLLRIAASEKANQTLDRWTNTVKHFRRAEHLMFPLPESLPNAGLDNSELLPISRKAVGTELESTIMAIMEESGLSASKPTPEHASKGDEGNPQTISRAELQSVWSDRRREREHQSREQARAKRIKKIKSKAYRRVHRKAQLRDELAIEEQERLEGGGEDSEDEAEAAHRRRAMERMGARHRQSKWAKAGKGANRAAWDDEFREGLNDMARRDAELRRRVEGRTKDSEDDESASSDSDHDGGKERILRELEEAEAAVDDTPRSALMNMPFMKKAEAAQKKINDETIAQIVRDLNSENDEEDGDEDLDEQDVGRRKFGPMGSKKGSQTNLHKPQQKQGGSLSQGPPGNGQVPAASNLVENPRVSTADPGAPGAWSKPMSSRERRKARRHNGNTTLDIAEATSLAVAKPRQRSKSSKSANDQGETVDASDTSDEEGAPSHLIRIRDAELAARAFGGDDVEVEFAKEKAQIGEEDDDKIVDQGMPGWGTWAGEGVSKRSVKRDQKRQALVQGVKKKTDRKDSKLERVIVSERRVRKNDKYLASKLPFEFETQDQYERALRLPLGPEWSTKETFQDLTKPRIMTKQGIITPISKPKLL